MKTGLLASLLRWHDMLRDQMIQGYPEQFN